MRLHSITLAGAGALAAVLAVASGCSRATRLPTTPDDTTVASLSARVFEEIGPARGRDWSSYFPLDSGSVWTYAREYRTNLSPGDGVGAMEVFRSRITSRMLGPRVMGGPLYSLLASTESSDLGDFSWEDFLRPDAMGLYQLDFRRRPAPAASGLRERVEALGTSLAERAAWRRVVEQVEARRAEFERGAPGTGGYNEYRRLAYPLSRGAQWNTTGFPGTQVTVEGREVLRTAQGAVPAWRLRVDPVGRSGPGDFVHEWYGRAGYLGRHSHFTIMAIDDSGNLYGFAEVEDWERLERFELAPSLRRGGRGADPVAGAPGIGPAGNDD